MDRYWFLTWTTYGTWLPGDARGFVGPVPGPDGRTEIHNIPGTPYDADMPVLKQAARERLKCPPIFLNLDKARELLSQFRETTDCRGWKLLAAAIMVNHVHIVVGVRGDPDPARILGDYKSYGSRRLNRRWTKPASGTWWTESGSKRKLGDERSLLGAVDYVLHRQENPLLIWPDPGERGA